MNSNPKLSALKAGILISQEIDFVFCFIFPQCLGYDKLSCHRTVLMSGLFFLVHLFPGNKATQKFWSFARLYITEAKDFNRLTHSHTLRLLTP